MSVSWYVSTSSFGAYVGGASHWYGEIGREGVCPHSTPLTRVLDRASARRLSTDDFTEHAGEETERFDSRAEVISAAIALFEGSATAGDQLLLGRDIGQDRTIIAVKS